MFRSVVAGLQQTAQVGAMSALLFGFSLSADAQQVRFFPIDADAEIDGEQIEVEVDTKPIVAPKHWVGILTSKPSDEVKTQLELKDNSGLVIEHVAPESPAEKAGLKEQDVILKANGKDLAEVEQLIEILRENKGKELKLQVLRDGEKQEIKVTPAERPENARQNIPRIEFQRPPQDPKELAKWMKRFQMEGMNKPHQFQWFGPGAVMRGGVATTAKMPENLSISITREGNNPTKITVKQADKTWNITEKELGELPEEIRPHVERMLPSQGMQPHFGKFHFQEMFPHGVARSFSFPFQPHDPNHLVPVVPEQDPNLNNGKNTVEQRQNLEQQMEKLQSAMEEMQNKMKLRDAKHEAVEKLLKKLLQEK